MGEGGIDGKPLVPNCIRKGEGGDVRLEYRVMMICYDDLTYGVCFDVHNGRMDSKEERGVYHSHGEQ